MNGGGSRPNPICTPALPQSAPLPTPLLLRQNIKGFISFQCLVVETVLVLRGDPQAVAATQKLIPGSWMRLAFWEGVRRALCGCRIPGPQREGRNAISPDSRCLALSLLNEIGHERASLLVASGWNAVLICCLHPSLQELLSDESCVSPRTISESCCQLHSSTSKEYSQAEKPGVGWKEKVPELCGESEQDF